MKMDRETLIREQKRQAAQVAAVKTGYYAPEKKQEKKNLVEDGLPLKLHVTAVEALLNMIEMYSGRKDDTLLRKNIESWWLATHTNKTTGELYLVDAKTAKALYEKSKRMQELGPDAV